MHRQNEMQDSHTGQYQQPRRKENHGLGEVILSSNNKCWPPTQEKASKRQLSKMLPTQVWLISPPEGAHRKGKVARVLHTGFISFQAL